MIRDPGSVGHHGDCQVRHQDRTCPGRPGLEEPHVWLFPQLTGLPLILNYGGGSEPECSLLRPLLQAPSHTGLGTNLISVHTGCDLQQKAAWGVCSGHSPLKRISVTPVYHESSVVRDPQKRPKVWCWELQSREGVSVGEPGVGNGAMRKAPIPSSSLTCSSRLRSLRSGSGPASPSADSPGTAWISPASAPHTCLELWGGCWALSPEDSPHPVCTAGGVEGLSGLLLPGVPAVEMGRSPWYTVGARKNRSLLPNPKPTRSTDRSCFWKQG